jgi:Bacterial protein of unknown function (DUF885)
MTLARRFAPSVCALTLLFAVSLPTINTHAQDQTVPVDLKPLLAAPQSEMRMVAQWYTLDRVTLSGNYANGGGRSGGRGGRGGNADSASAPPPPVPVSAGRIARLKRFDTNWQAALGQLDAGKLTPAAKNDLDQLKSTISGNLARLDADALTMARVMAVAPFAPKIVQLVEARIRVEEMNAQRAAGTVTEITREIARLTATPPRVNREQATLGATAVDQLRTITTEWFNFYNGYDPLFTWWMGMPHAKVDEALKGYASLLREKVAAENLSAPLTPATAEPIAAAPQLKHSDVPNVADIISLPQDEMRDVVTRFTGAGSGGGGRGGGRGGSQAPRDPAFYKSWLTALKSLDFARLSRNAQVDYLFIRRTSETQLARANLKLDPNPPRKTDTTGIPGPARGREGLIQDLSEALIPYTPEELIAVAEQEFAWCDREMLKASREMGFGDDWKKAIEKTKDAAVPPGGQPRMIMDLLIEAVDYLRANSLITVPQVAAESLHMIMMTPERQLVNPFFTGGNLMSVSYPTNTMEYDARIQSMRGNNPGFSHATAFHEMIPGHNLVGFLGTRFNDYRANLTGGGAFFGEGWPLYWELTLYDMGFNKTPEQRVGALFWRMHRCARIIFSLKFHMGQWSPQEAIDFLVDRVGHERDNATAEVRRSFDPAAGYGPLYQAAYLLGGLQLRGLRKEVVDTRIMTNTQFHDEIMRQGGMPIALLRLAVNKRIPLARDMDISWKFYGDLK